MRDLPFQMLAAALFFLVVYLPTVAAVFAFQRWVRGVGVYGKPPSPAFVAAAAVPVVAGILASFVHPAEGSTVFFGFILLCWTTMAVIIFLKLWLREFVGLMSLGDDAFPGRFDKVIWAGLMLVLPPLGVVAFGAFRRAHWPAAKPVNAGRAAEWI